MSKSSNGENVKTSYKKLAWMGLLHLPFMYAIMFAMVYSGEEIFQNLNTFYMAVMMVAPMIFLMPLTMPDMYKDKKRNLIAYGIALSMLLVGFMLVRAQSFIGDRQFMRSMIPHHSGAILMCERAKIQDAELKALCTQIVVGQKAEIEKMKKILDRI
jgi:Domain of unknown function (DUF305)